MPRATAEFGLDLAFSLIVIEDEVKMIPEKNDLCYYVGGMKEFYRFLGTLLVGVATTLLIVGFYIDNYGFVSWIFAGVIVFIAVYCIYQYSELCKRQDEEDRLQKQREETQRRRESARRLAPRVTWDPDSSRSKKTKE